MDKKVEHLKKPNVRKVKMKKLVKLKKKIEHRKRRKKKKRGVREEPTGRKDDKTDTEKRIVKEGSLRKRMFLVGSSS